MPLPQHYVTLGVGLDATAAEIKRKFYKIAKEHHPDKSSDPASQGIYRRAADAYEILKNLESRDKYDSYLAEGLFTGHGQGAPTPSERARKAAADAQAADDAKVAAAKAAALAKAAAVAEAAADAQAAAAADAKAAADARAYADTAQSVW